MAYEMGTCSVCSSSVSLTHVSACVAPKRFSVASAHPFAPSSLQSAVVLLPLIPAVLHR